MRAYTDVLLDHLRQIDHGSSLGRGNERVWCFSAWSCLVPFWKSIIGRFSRGTQAASSRLIDFQARAQQNQAESWGWARLAAWASVVPRSLGRFRIRTLRTARVSSRKWAIVNFLFFFPKRWQSGCIKVNPGTAARVRVSRCGSMWWGGGRKPAGSARWPEICQKFTTSISVIYHLYTDRIASGRAMNDRFSKHKWTKMM